jgi:cytochrome b
MSARPETTHQADAIPVWDAFVRVFHWTLAVGFFVAYLSEDVMWLHVWTGYLVGVLILMRIVWGFVGPQHARFSDFAFPPKAVLAYLADLVRFKAIRHLGHSPAGAVMVWALLAGLLAIVGSGLVLYALEEDAGPLAGFVSTEPAGLPLAETAGEDEARFALISSAQADEDDDAWEDDDAYRRAEHGEHEGSEEFWEELHEVLANLVLVLVLLHIGGVLFASFVTRENLPRSMVTGRKRPLDQ